MSARDAVDRIVADISDRSMGWDSIDDDIKDEIRETGVVGGSPRIDGTRLYVSLFVQRGMHGGTDADITHDYPQVTAADLRSCWVSAARYPRVIAHELAYCGLGSIEMTLPPRLWRRRAERMVRALEREVAAAAAPEIRAWARGRMRRRG